jgi:hypothetical protein
LRDGNGIGGGEIITVKNANYAKSFYCKDAKSRSDKRKLASYEVAGVSGKNKICPARDNGIVRIIAVAK